MNNQINEGQKCRNCGHDVDLHNCDPHGNDDCCGRTTEGGQCDCKDCERK